MRKNRRKLQVAENAQKLGLDKLYYSNLSLLTMKRRGRKAGELAPGEKRMVFIASPYDQSIIDAARKKHNLKNASEIFRMALKRFAEHEGLEAAS